MKQFRDMILLLFITSVLISYSSGQWHVTCFNSEGSTRYCLSYINKYSTWENANSYCKTKNGTLAVLEDSNINSKIDSSLKSASINTNSVWVGGYRYNGHWIWLNGNNIKQTQFLQGQGDCVFLNVNAKAILNYHCKIERPFICQFNIEHYTFCVPGMPHPNEICYTYMKSGLLSSWCSARISCFERGGDLASLDRDVEPWNKFLIDAQATRVFVGAAFNLTRWQWLDGNNIDRVNKSVLEISPSLYPCAVLARNDDFTLLPIKCNDSEKFDFLCELGSVFEHTSWTSVCAQGTQMPTQIYKPFAPTTNSEHKSLSPAWSPKRSPSAPETYLTAFVSGRVLTKSHIMSSGKGNVTYKPTTFNNLASIDSSSKGMTSGVSMINQISVLMQASPLTNPATKSPPQLSKTQSQAPNGTTRFKLQRSFWAHLLVVEFLLSLRF